MQAMPQAGWSPAGQYSGNNQPRQAIYTGSSGSGGSVNGASTQQAPVYGPGLGTYGPTDYYNGPTYGPAYSGPQRSSAPAPAPSAPTGPSEADIINSVYDSQMNDLNSQQDTASRNYGSIQGDINSQAANAANTITSNFNQSNSGLDLTSQQGTQRRDDALTAARRLYNDLIMGGTQRFGGASSAGEAYQALTGRQLQQNDQSIGSQYNDFMGQVGLARTNIKAKFDDAIAQNEMQKNMALNQAYRDFQDSISQINSLKNQASQEKAANQLSALQNLRNQIYNINIATSQNSQAVNNMRAQAEANLQDTLNKFGQGTTQANNAQMAFGANTTTNPTNGLTFANTPGAASNPYQAGQISPTQRNDHNFWDQMLA